MNTLKTGLAITLMGLFAVSCSVISSEVKSEAVPPMPFRTLAHEADQYVGKTVILGGYILETRNNPDETIIEVLQTPLKSRQEPKSRDLSEGRLIVSHEGFLDPEIYSKDRKITVAGTLIGCSAERVETCRIESREIYLWSEHEYRDPYGYYGGSVLYPYGYHRYPYRRYPYHRYPGGRR